MSTALCHKTAISIPSDVLAAADRAARERGKSRSAFITDILRAALRARRDAEITRRLNRLFTDEALSEEQRRGAEALDVVGSSWADEMW